MDIDKVNFPAKLLEILTAVSESSFVSLDLELSGIPVRQSNQRAGKQTLQERYAEVKTAAEKYQILQIGLTCVKEDFAAGTYECRPYNINLSPVVEEKIDIDRDFSFHSGAVEFLLGVGFQFNLPFQWGVPYLSRDEVKAAILKADTRHDGNAYPDMVIKPEDTETLAFMHRVRFDIGEWMETLGSPDHGQLYIGPTANAANQDGPQSEELSRFERRLVHQLVRAEYPGLVTIPKRGLILIQQLDQEREDYIKAQRKKEARERIYRQVGFRWVIEAIAGNDLSKIDLKSLAKDPNTGESVFVDLQDLRAKFNRAQVLVRKRPRVVVGHNFFLDIVYIYRTFIGELPETVEEFQIILHDLFPLIIDTKYMATHNCGDINPMSSLQQLAEHLAEQGKPTISTHEHHGKYKGVTAFHEAGYDSLLTAEVAVRLSARLEARGEYSDEAEALSKSQSEVIEANDSGGVSLTGATGSFSPAPSEPSWNQASSMTSAVNGLKDMLLGSVKAIASATQASDETAAATSTTAAKQKKGGKKNKDKTEATDVGRFAHKTAFSMLQDMPSEDEVLQFDDLPSSDRAVPDTDETIPEDQTGVMSSQRPSKKERESMRHMPRFNSEFWKVYGNKLRVFGSQEGVCILSNQDTSSSRNGQTKKPQHIRW